MSPRRQPSSLLEMCTTRAFVLIATTCHHIFEKNQKKHLMNQEADSLKKYLMKMLPARFFEILCLKRQTLEIHIDPHLWLRILIHPNMNVFKNCELDTIVPKQDWFRILPQFQCLRVLDLEFICNDKLLKVIAKNCLLLEKLNIVSFRNEISLTGKKISDIGLKHLTNLKKLRKLTLDPATSHKFSNREISTKGIRMLLKHLPLLEKLQMQRHICIASIVYAAGMDLSPLQLTALRSIDTNPKVLKQVIQMCPCLRKLSVTYNPLYNDSDILNEIINSNVRLNKLILTKFPYSSSMARLLEVQNTFLTELTLENLPRELDLDALEMIGLTCPNLVFFSLHILVASFLRKYSFRLRLPRPYTGPKIFQKLECLKLAGNHYDIERITIFLTSCTHTIKSLFVKYDTQITCTYLNYAINNGYLKNIERLVLDNLVVSKDVISALIKECEALNYLILTCDVGKIDNFIRTNNYDLYFKNNKDEDTDEFLKYRARLYFVNSLTRTRPLHQRFKNYTKGYNIDDFVEETLSTLLKKSNSLSKSTKPLTRRTYY